MNTLWHTELLDSARIHPLHMHAYTLACTAVSLRASQSSSSSLTCEVSGMVLTPKPVSTAHGHLSWDLDNDYLERVSGAQPRVGQKYTQGTARQFSCAVMAYGVMAYAGMAYVVMARNIHIVQPFSFPLSNEDSCTASDEAILPMACSCLGLLEKVRFWLAHTIPTDSGSYCGNQGECEESGHVFQSIWAI